MYDLNLEIQRTKVTRYYLSKPGRRRDIIVWKWVIWILLFSFLFLVLSLMYLWIINNNFLFCFCLLCSTFFVFVSFLLLLLWPPTHPPTCLSFFPRMKSALRGIMSRVGFSCWDCGGTHIINAYIEYLIEHDYTASSQVFFTRTYTSEIIRHSREIFIDPF